MANVFVYVSFKQAVELPEVINIKKDERNLLKNNIYEILKQFLIFLKLFSSIYFVKCLKNFLYIHEFICHFHTCKWQLWSVRLTQNRKIIRKKKLKCSKHYEILIKTRQIINQRQSQAQCTTYKHIIHTYRCTCR